jgi:hypothetical protein
MLTEKLFEDILVKYPELIEDRLIFIGRQVTHFGKRLDILFEDRFKEKLIVELKKDNLDRNALSQVLEYEGYILSEKDPSARVMIIANRIPLNLKKAMDHHGIEYKEIPHKQLFDFLEKKDVQLLETIMSQKNDESHLHSYIQSTDKAGTKVISTSYKPKSQDIIGIVNNVKTKNDAIDRFEIWISRNYEMNLPYGRTLSPEGIPIKIRINEKVFTIGFHNTKSCIWLSARFDRDGYNLTDLLEASGISNRDKLVLNPLGNDTYSITRLDNPKESTSLIEDGFSRMHSRRGKIIDLLNNRKSDQEILEILDREFPPGVFSTSNKQALYGTKRDLAL